MATDQQQSQAGRAAEQVKEKSSEVASQAQAKVQETTQQVKAQTGDRVRQEVDRRSTQAGEQAQTVASAVRQTAQKLREEGKEPHAKVAEQAADRVERVGGYLRDSDADRILGDVEDFMRRRPWVVGAAAAALGLVASRFLKASSGRRYDDRQSGDGYRGHYDPGYAALPTARQPAYGAQVETSPYGVAAVEEERF